MKQFAHWTLSVSRDVDRRVRRYLEGAGRKGDLSGFVEEAVRERLLELSMKTAHSNPSANDVAVPSESSESVKGDGSYGG
jgi:hypothetical protein